jgi:hypothetical protein
MFDCNCDANNNQEKIMSSKNRFTFNVNFTSTPKINKFRPKQQQQCWECRIHLEDAKPRPLSNQPMTKRGYDHLEATLVDESSKKSSLVLVSINDYLRRILQKKSSSNKKSRSAKKSSSSVQNLSRRRVGGDSEIVNGAGIDFLVSRKHSLRHTKKRVSLRRTGRREAANSCRQSNSKTTSKPSKSSPIDVRRFCDLKFNETNNYNISTVASNGFNQFGQLKVWYV